MTAENEQRVLAFGPPEKNELDEEYDCDVDDYHPVQPLVHDHGVSFVCLSSASTKIDQHVIQVGRPNIKVILISYRTLLFTHYSSGRHFYI